MGHKSPHGHTTAVGKRKKMQPAIVSERLEEARLSQVRELARAHTESAVETLAGIMKHTDAPASSRVAAAKAILEFGWGRPGSTDEKRGGVSGGLTVNILRLGDGQAGQTVELRKGNDFSLEDVDDAVDAAERVLQMGFGP